MDYTAKQAYQTEFTVTLKVKLENRLKKKITDKEICPFSNTPYNEVYYKVAYLYILTDEELSVLIDDCIDNGFATQIQIAKLFGVRRHILEKRISEAERYLQCKWHSIVEHISENYDIVKPSDIVCIVKDKDGNEVDSGVGVQVRDLAKRGIDKTGICEMLRINPASFAYNPKLEQEFKLGESEARYAQKQFNEQVLVKGLIKTQWFELKGLPTWKKLAEGYTVQLIKDEFHVKENEDGEKSYEHVKRTITDKHIQPDKEALNKLTKIAGIELLNNSKFDPKEIDMGLQISNEPQDNFNESGRFIAQDAEFQEVEDD